MKLPTAPAANCTVNVVKAPGATDVLSKVETTEKPGGRAMGPESVRSAAPRLRTVKVLAIGAPRLAVPDCERQCTNARMISIMIRMTTMSSRNSVRNSLA